MVIFLPNTCGGFAEMETAMGYHFNFNQLHDQLYKRTVNLNMPIFAIDYELPNIKNALLDVMYNTENLFLCAYSAD